MQSTDPPPRSGQIFMEGAECAEQIEKRNKIFLQFLFFELWVKINRKWVLF